MSREWKPGDVALVVNKHGVTNRAICQVQPSRDHWVFGVSHTSQPMEGSDARPLVVIDPEDREQVERLCAAMKSNGWTEIDDDAPGDMQVVLRSLVAPPKPDEPMGLGAVVEDADGDKFARVAANDGWVRCDARSFSRFRWADIAAVRVLSEGVA